VKIMQEIRGEKIKMIIVVGKISEDDWKYYILF
jgi:hypothetical protein